MNDYSLWSEGYAATGEHAPAQYLGTWSGENIGEAIQKWHANSGGDKAWGSLRFDEKTNTWSSWGCRIFDNETDARKSFG